MLERLIDEAPTFFSYYNLLFLFQALLTTLALTAAGCLLGFALGFALATVRRVPGVMAWPLRVIAIFLTETFRRIPFLVTLFLVFYAFQIGGADLPVFVVALIAVVIIAGAFIAEIIRAGLDSVHPNQWDAAAAMNFSLPLTLYYVILPQAWKVILPPAFSFFILFIKDTALASQIGVVELTYAGKVLNNKGFSAVLVFGAVLVLYFLLSYPLTRLGARLEARLASHRNR